MAGYPGFLSLWALATLAGEDRAWEELELRRQGIEKREAGPMHDLERIVIECEKAYIERMPELRGNR